MGREPRAGTALPVLRNKGSSLSAAGSLLVNRRAVFPIGPADRGTDARPKRLLVNDPPVFPVRPADGGTDVRSGRLLVNRRAVFPVRPADWSTDPRSRSLLVNRLAVFPVRPADWGTDPRSRSLLVNRLAVFPVRPADWGTDPRSSSLLVNRLAVFPVRPADWGTDARSRSLLVNRRAVSPIRPADWGTDPRSRSLLVNRLAVFPVRPADRGTDARSRSLLVNGPAVFPVRPADGGGAHAHGSVSRDPPWPFSGIPVPDSPLTRRHPRSLYVYPPFFVHFVHFVVPVRSRAILPDVLAQFRGVILRPCRADRGSRPVRRADGPALGRRAPPDKTPSGPFRAPAPFFRRGILDRHPPSGTLTLGGSFSSRFPKHWPVSATRCSGPGEKWLLRRRRAWRARAGSAGSWSVTPCRICGLSTRCTAA